MEQSILKSVKKVLGIDNDLTAFDLDILMHINSAFGTLHQLGIGPENGFTIEDDTAVWADFIGTDPRYNGVRTYVYMKVRFIFDPPQSGYAVTAMEKQIQEAEWRLNLVWEGDNWTPPTPVTTPDDVILDGGDA